MTSRIYLSKGHEDGRGISESKEEQASGHSIISREMSAFFAQSGQRYHPIFDKFESEHVSQFLKKLSRYRGGKSKAIEHR